MGLVTVRVPLLAVILNEVLSNSNVVAVVLFAMLAATFAAAVAAAADESNMEGTISVLIKCPGKSRRL